MNNKANMKNRILMYSGVFFSTLILSFLLDDPMVAGLIVLGVFMPTYIWISVRRQKSRIRLLEEDCDPIAFIEATEKQYQITGRNKVAHLHLMIDKSAGLASLGKFEEALNLLLSLDVKKIKKSKLRRLVYFNNLMLCYDGLHQDEQVQELYRNEFSVYSPKFAQIKHVKAVILFAKFKYEKSDTFEETLQMRQQLISELKNMKLSKRLNLHLILCQSELAEMEKNEDLAASLLKEVINNGNTLHIVEIAKQRLEMLPNMTL